MVAYSPIADTQIDVFTQKLPLAFAEGFCYIREVALTFGWCYSQLLKCPA